MSDSTLPPGPRSPVALQMTNWVLRPVQFMTDSWKEYGDIFTLRLYSKTHGNMVLTANPDTIKEIFTGDPEVFRAGESNALLQPILGSNSLLLLDGKQHLRQRKLLLPPFHGERVKRYTEVIAEAAEEEISKWPVGSTVSMQQSMMDITLEVIMRVVFGVDRSSPVDELRDALKAFTETASRPLARYGVLVLMHVIPRTTSMDSRYHPLHGIERLRSRVDRAIYAQIDRRRKDPNLSERDDILSMLLQAVDEDSQPMSDVEIRDQLMSLLIAGHETTTTSLAWAYENLTRHPEILANIESEADLELSQAVYTEATVRETLRLRPPIFLVARKLSQPVELAGYNLPARTNVVPAIYLVNRHPELYEKPESFIPERFLNKRPDTYSWLPFGGGVRRCIGAAFAELEMKVIMQTLSRRVRFVCDRNDRAEPISIRAIVVAPKRGASVKIAEKKELIAA